MSGGKTALGLDANVGAMLCYLPVCAVNLIYSIIVLVTEKNDRFVRFHAFQSLLLMALCFVVMLVLGIFTGVLIAATNSMALAMLMNLVFWGVLLVFIAVAIFMCVKAFGRSQTKLPIIGDLAEKWA